MTYERLDYGSPDGSQWGGSSSDALGFHGGTPQSQYQSGATQASSRVGEVRVFVIPASTLAYSYSSATTEDAVSASSMAADSCIVVSRSSTTPGTAIVGYHASTAADWWNVTMMNVSTAATVVPVSTQAYQVIEFKANGGFVTTATLTPVAVAASTTAEQEFTVPGALPGQMVVVNKPTAQRQLGIGNARVTAISTVAIAFANNSSVAITPTAAETYTFALIPTLHAASPIVQYGLAATTLSAAVGISTCVEATTTLLNLDATDFAVGYTVPALQAGVFPVQARVNSSGVYGLTWANNSSGSLTPTSSHMLGITILKTEMRPAVQVFTTTFAGTTVPASTTIEYTSTCNGLVTSSVVFVNKLFHTANIGVANARVSAANEITVALFNTASTATVVGAGQYMIGATPRAPSFGIGGSVPAGMAALNSTCAYMSLKVDPTRLGTANDLRTAFAANGFLPG